MDKRIKRARAKHGRGDGRRKKSKTGERCSYQTAQVGLGYERRKKSKTGEDGSYHTAQFGPRDKETKMNNNRNGFDLDLIWI